MVCSGAEWKHWNDKDLAPFKAGSRKQVASEVPRDRDPVQVIAARA